MKTLVIFVVLCLLTGPLFADVLLASQIPAELQRDMTHLQNNLIAQFWDFTTVFKVYGLIVAAFCTLMWAVFTKAALRLKK